MNSLDLSWPPSPKELAVVLGLDTPSRDCRIGTPRDEKEAFEISRQFTSALFLETTMAVRDVTCSGFCVKYLPRLIESVLSPEPRLPPPVGGRCDRLLAPDTSLLIQLVQNKYLIKFFLSIRPSARASKPVIPCLLERLKDRLPVYLSRMRTDPDARDPFTETTYRDHIFGLCSTLLNYFIIQMFEPSPLPIPPETISSLWDNLGRFNPDDVNIRRTVADVRCALRKDLRWLDNMGQFSGMTAIDLLTEMHECAEKSCHVKADTGKLFLCSRCETVVYCGRAHQRAHWLEPSATSSAHKAVCYSTPW